MLQVRYDGDMIATFTDFGIAGPYLGQVRAALHRDAPGIPVADIFPDLPAFNIKAAAYLLPAYCQYLPDNSVCLCVVDPGVGTARRATVVQCDGRWFVGPDNGLFSVLARRASDVQAFIIDWRPEQLSSSFHGRDLFAPVAARLACGEPPPGRALKPARLVTPDWPADLAEIVYLDTFGNAITGLRAAGIDTGNNIEVAGARCEYRRTFGEAEPGKPFWYENANGLVEVALAGGSAVKTLGLEVGNEIQV
ncbi:MAG: S-adenosyl-l-methionine hydroxide adenosyltransferase family protein [Thiogranum sp.]